MSDCKHKFIMDDAEVQYCQHCLKSPAEAQVDELTAERDRLKEALEKLARLGNGAHYGNSDGNVIAQKALESNDA